MKSVFIPLHVFQQRAFNIMIWYDISSVLKKTNQNIVLLYSIKQQRRG